MGPSCKPIALVLACLAGACGASSAEPTAPEAPPATGSAAPPLVAPAFAPRAARTLAAGADFGCRVNEAGGVECWGGAPRSGSDPWQVAAVDGLAGVVELAARGDRACARLETGEIACWRIGGVPSRVEGVQDALELSLGDRHGCARTGAGAVRCWSDGAASASAVAGVSGAVGLASAKDTTCARSEQGELWCWSERGPRGAARRVGGVGAVRDAVGYDEVCVLGPGTTITCLDPDTLAPLHHESAQLDGAALLAGAGWGCSAAKLELRCWGAHPFIGPDRAEGLAPQIATTSVPEITAGAAHVCALVEREATRPTVLCWGDNRAGQLGSRTPEALGRPTRVEGISDARAIAAGDRHTCVLRASGQLACFGDPELLSLGGPLAPGERLVEPPGITQATALDAAGAHTCVVHDGGRVACFGLGSDGQLGDGPPLASALAKSSYFSQFIRDTFAVESNGLTYALPYAETIGSVRAVKGLPRASSVSLSREASCADTNQGFYCWGTSGFERAPASSDDGEGDCIAPPRPTLSTAARALAERPVKIKTGAGVKAFGVTKAAMFAHASCSVDAAGRGHCAGALEQPVASLDVRATGLRMRDDRACFLQAGRPRCYDVSFGVLPIEDDAGGAEEIVDLALGRDHRCELDASGGARCVGTNGLGELGRGLSALGEALAPVIGLDRVIDLAATESGTCAVRDDGSVWCWGGGAQQVGQPSPTFSPLPLEVGRS